ncbi:SDR family oxidoreductase [Pelagicoccus sp. SDUM812002]|uniref:SDR family oxidoreductase n=1 Tax=Pelagicoccus sp. SDUM812002 TaxID=3041266 RepID=UPI00280D93C5|nr:SDR family oxidoreductase [Pelagicoccus sp. SDUM812002]MDQ8184124.1 SDR family oxidoreductase [Pelagicoccus sp. SDUM812002]
MNRDGFPRTVVITGGSAGVGRATARAFASEGCNVGLVAREEGRLKATAQEVESLGGRALVVVADVAVAEEVEAAAARVEAVFGPIDAWINNAMTSVFASVDDITEEEFERVIDVTFLGYVYGAKAALRRMRPRNRGVIVQVGSALAYRGIPLQSAYCSAKHAIQGFTDSLRCELLHDGSAVRVVMVQMPALNTPQFDWVRSRLPKRAQPVPPIYQPEVAADALVYAARRGDREIVVGSSSWKAILFNKMFPGIADRMLARSGFASQQTEENEDEGREDNLFAPVQGHFDAHGAFDDRAKERSLAWTLSRAGSKLVMGAGMLALGAIATTTFRRWMSSR